MEAGDKVVVVSPSQVSEWEQNDELAEVVGLGNKVLWHILYDGDGVLYGGRRITDVETVHSCRAEFERLFHAGEVLSSYFNRVVLNAAHPTIVRSSV